MRVALIGPVYPFRGGIAHYTTMLGRELRQAGHETRVFSFIRQYPAWAYPGKSDRDPSREPLAVEDVEYSLDLLNPLTWRRTAGRIRAYAPDVVVMQWWTSVWAPVWWALARSLRRVPRPELLFICHNVLPHEPRLWDAGLARAVLRLADRIVVSSEQERENLHALLPNAPADIVPLPVFDMLAGAMPPRDEARARLGLSPEGPVLLNFGLVRSYKGVRYLLDALPRVREAFPDVQLVIAGEFWEDRGPYLAQVAQLGLEDCVTIVDRYIPNEETPLYFAAADVVVLPYTRVTQSGVAQLALGFRKPLIATRVGGLTDVIRPGRDGLLVAPEDADALAEGIVAFLRGDIAQGESQPAPAGRGWDQLTAAVTASDAGKDGR